MITHADLVSVVSREAFREWQKNLIYQDKRHRRLSDADRAVVKEDAAQRQQELAEAIARGPRAVRDFLCDVVPSPRVVELVDGLPDLPHPLTEAEMVQTTFHVDREVSTVLDDWGITPMLAGEPTFWALCHARWIGDGMFPDGVARVFAGGEKNPPDTEKMARTFLRRVCGLPVERGNTSVITDCVLSGSWWRYRLATEVSRTLAAEGETLGVEQAHRVLQSSAAWERFVMNLIRKLASLNAPRARAAVVLALHEHSQRGGGTSVSADVVNDCMQRVAQLGDRFSFALVDWTMLVEVAAESLDVEVNDAIDC